MMHRKSTLNLFYVFLHYKYPTMKIIFCLLAIHFTFLLNAQVMPNLKIQENITNAEKKHHKKLLEHPKSLTGYNYNMSYQRFYWEVNPAVNYIKGSVTTYFKPVHASMTEMSFDMTASLQCDSVLYHGTSITKNHSSEELIISLPVSIPLGQPDSITVFYQGIPPSNGMGSFTQALHGTDPIIWTLSEPYGAKDWMPCKQTLTDKIDSIDIFIKSPSQYKVASNGLLISEQVSGTDKTTHWKHRHPIVTYLIAFAVTNYSVYSDWVHYANGDSLEVLNYVYPENLATAQQGTANTPALINLYNQYFIDYPFNNEKYGHAECGFGGGMEHQTMTFCGSFSYELIAHELAHQWFGDYITCGSWHDIWINEGFATYLTGWTYEKFSYDFYWPAWKTAEIEFVTELPDGSVYCADTTSVDRIFDGRLSYSKGALLLHMLRWEIGDTAFFAGMRGILTDPNLVNGFAYTPDIIHHFETTGDTSLTEFFNDWFYGEGYPIYQIGWSQNLSNVVTLTINQTQSHPSVSFFEMDLPIRFIGDTKDTICKINNISNNQIINIPLDFTVNILEFDPDHWIVTRNPVIQRINEIVYEEDIRIVPNPVKDQVTVYSKKALHFDKIEIVNILGNVIITLSPEGKKNTILIDTHNLGTGNYIVKMKIGDTLISKKLIKE